MPEPITVTCPNCKTVAKTTTVTIGKRIRCHKCASTILVQDIPDALPITSSPRVGGNAEPALGPHRRRRESVDVGNLGSHNRLALIITILVSVVFVLVVLVSALLVTKAVPPEAPVVEAAASLPVESSPTEPDKAVPVPETLGKSLPVAKKTAAIAKAKDWPFVFRYQTRSLEISWVSALFTKVPVQELGRGGASKEPQLIILVRIENLSDTRKIDYRTWAARGDKILQPHMAKLTDELGNSYKALHYGLFGKVIGQIEEASIHPGKATTDLLVFEKPIDRATALHLDLPLEAIGSHDVARLTFPAMLIQSDPDERDGFFRDLGLQRLLASPDEYAGRHVEFSGEAEIEVVGSNYLLLFPNAAAPRIACLLPASTRFLEPQHHGQRMALDVRGEVSQFRAIRNATIGMASTTAISPMKPRERMKPRDPVEKKPPPVTPTKPAPPTKPATPVAPKDYDPETLWRVGGKLAGEKVRIKGEARVRAGIDVVFVTFMSPSKVNLVTCRVDPKKTGPLGKRRGGKDDVWDLTVEGTVVGASGGATVVGNAEVTEVDRAPD